MAEKEKSKGEKKGRKEKEERKGEKEGRKRKEGSHGTKRWDDPRGRRTSLIGQREEKSNWEEIKKWPVGTELHY